MSSPPVLSDRFNLGSCASQANGRNVAPNAANLPFNDSMPCPQPRVQSRSRTFDLGTLRTDGLGDPVALLALDARGRCASPHLSDVRVGLRGKISDQSSHGSEVSRGSPNSLRALTASSHSPIQSSIGPEFFGGQRDMAGLTDYLWK